MDLSKYPLEKLIYYLAAIIPGFVALLIFQTAAPGSFGWFFALGFLGYKTKLALVLLASFVIGYTLTTFLGAVLLFVGGAYGGIISKRPYKQPHTYETAPWRDPRWRTVLKTRLGTDAPNDSTLIFPNVLKLRQEMIGHLPQPQREGALAELERERLSLELDDTKWAGWYEHYHQVVLQPSGQDWHFYMTRGISLNLEATALYVLISACFVPSLRHWWCIVPACIWVLILLGQELGEVKRYMEKWSTLFAQIKYLSEPNH